jgi:type IV pilus assembly protein PilA
MLHQNLRAKIGARLSSDKESGFTLIELLVVMLILGILAAIALPAFFNQKDKATDSEAKAFAHSGQVAMETYATDNNNSYEKVSDTVLEGIETTLTGADLTATGTKDTYKVTVKSDTNTEFSIERDAEGITTLTCTPKGKGGCPGDGTWGD